MSQIACHALRVGDRARILGFTADGAVDYVCALMAFGLVPGVEIRVQAAAPWGDPVKLAVGNLCISLRRAEASCLLLEKLESVDGRG